VLILVEGPDRAGKSTLVAKLASHLRHPAGGSELVRVHHRGPPTAHPIVEYEQSLWTYRPGTGRHVICDRWHLGEVVYPRVLGRESLMDDPAWFHIELFLAARGALLVHVTGDPDQLATRVAIAGPKTSGIEPKHVEQITTGFWDAFERSTLSWYQLTGPSTQDDVDAIVDLARRAERATSGLAGFVTYVGSPQPRALVVGDTRGDPTSDAPAFVPYRATSGHFLLRSLRDEATSLGFVNACDVDDFKTVWDAVDRPPVVALGKNAARNVAREIAPVAELPHPQYVRRFQHGLADAYGRAIVDAIGKTGRQPWDREAGWPSWSRRSYQNHLTMPET
jgi:hypothetical protein